MAPLPDGDVAPDTGALPVTALAGLGERPFGVYLHVPFCASRCGYCDFNTYTPDELSDPGAEAGYVTAAVEEVRLARRVLGDVDLPAATVFVGGGTPTLLAPRDLARLLDTVRAEFGLAPGAEVSTEANPESVDPGRLEQLRAAGFTRVSFGMQSATPHVLARLDRRHTPGRAETAVAEARAAGFGSVSLDLIYGTPGEALSEWRHSVQAAVDTGVDHVSAYALVVEPGTRLARQVSRGELDEPDDDAMADAYLLADDVLAAAGLEWYEVSNWSRGPAAACRHNLAYWRSSDWWGIGPGAHSHVGGTRWWNRKHPRAYAERLAAGHSPALAREVLDEDTRAAERVMLGVRLAEGLPLTALGEAGRSAAAGVAADGRLDPAALASGKVVLTRRGRLLADAVVRDLLTEPAALASGS